MLAGDNSILQKSTEAKRTSERAEAKEQAQMDIMAYIADKTANHQDSSLDDNKVKDVLTDKSYVKEAKESSFVTAKGEYEIPYSELYTATEPTPTPTIKYGLRADGKYYCNPASTTGKFDSSINRFHSGMVYDEGKFWYEEDGGMSLGLINDDIEDDDVFYVWDGDWGGIDPSIQYYTTVDAFDSDGNFICSVYWDEDGGLNIGTYH